MDGGGEAEQNLFYNQAASKVFFNKSNVEFIHAAASEQEQTQSVVKINFCLPYLQGTLFATILEDAITQLRVLDECNNELRIMKTISEIADLRARKYQIVRDANEDQLVGVNCRNLGCMQFKLNKLAADRMYCNEVLVGTYLELSLNRCFSPIKDTSRNIEDLDTYRLALADEEAKNKALRRELARQLRQQRNRIKTVAYDTDLVIDQLKSKVEDAALHAETRSRYITNWQRSRTEQHKQTIVDREAGSSHGINYYRQRTDQEHRVHAEVDLLVNIFISATLQKVEKWMSKYDTDIDAIDLQIQIMKNKHQNAIERRQEMEEMYAHHEVLMKDWQQFKEDREKALQYRNLMTKSAIIVQAWWRGLLVRLELGPFKTSKRKPPAEVGKKKKK